MTRWAFWAYAAGCLVVCAVQALATGTGLCTVVACAFTGLCAVTGWLVTRDGGYA